MRSGEPIRLYEGAAPGSASGSHEERAYRSAIFDNEVVSNVVVPTLTPVLPAASCGTGVIVAPGGGYHALSIETEGFEVARWLAGRGIAAFVLKYRLVPCGEDAVAELVEKMLKRPQQFASDTRAVAPLAGADAAAAVRLVRGRASEFGIAPDRVGFVGFSAGGNVALRVAYDEDAGARPDFVAPIYATTTGVDLACPPEGSGPIFLVAASDDPLGLARETLDIYASWQRAGLPVELHLYANGGHGFGTKKQGLPSDGWIDRFGDWLASRGLAPGRGEASSAG